MAKKINVRETVLAARRELKSEEGLSPGLKATMDGVLDLVVVLANRLGLNSSNSSKPPSMDPNRPRKTRTTKGKRRKPGGQNGHSGSRLEQVKNPTVVEELLIDRRTLPPGKWKSAGFDKRQVFDIEVSFSVTEYQAEVLENELGETYVAEFPDGITLFPNRARCGGLLPHKELFVDLPQAGDPSNGGLARPVQRREAEVYENKVSSGRPAGAGQLRNF